jgi:hypothetical protein
MGQWARSAASNEEGDLRRMVKDSARPHCYLT